MKSGLSDYNTTDNTKNSRSIIHLMNEKRKLNNLDNQNCSLDGFLSDMSNIIDYQRNPAPLDDINILLKNKNNRLDFTNISLGSAKSNQQDVENDNSKNNSQASYFTSQIQNNTLVESFDNGKSSSITKNPLQINFKTNTERFTTPILKSRTPKKNDTTSIQESQDNTQKKSVQMEFVIPEIEKPKKKKERENDVSKDNTNKKYINRPDEYPMQSLNQQQQQTQIQQQISNKTINQRKSRYSNPNDQIDKENFNHSQKFISNQDQLIQFQHNYSTPQIKSTQNSQTFRFQSPSNSLLEQAKSQPSFESRNKTIRNNEYSQFLQQNQNQSPNYSLQNRFGQSNQKIGFNNSIDSNFNAGSNKPIQNIESQIQPHFQKVNIDDYQMLQSSLNDSVQQKGQFNSPYSRPNYDDSFQAQQTAFNFLKSEMAYMDTAHDQQSLQRSIFEDSVQFQKAVSGYDDDENPYKINVSETQIQDQLGIETFQPPTTMNLANKVNFEESIQSQLEAENRLQQMIKEKVLSKAIYEPPLFVSVMSSDELFLNPFLLQFEPEAYWANYNQKICFRNLINSYFRVSNTRITKFIYKLYNMLQITLKDPFYKAIIGTNWITTQIFSVNVHYFAAMLNLSHTAANSIVYNEIDNIFSVYNFVEVTPNNFMNAGLCEFMSTPDPAIKLMFHATNKFINKRMTQMELDEIENKCINRYSMHKNNSLVRPKYPAFSK